MDLIKLITFCSGSFIAYVSFRFVMERMESMQRVTQFIVFCTYVTAAGLAICFIHHKLAIILGLPIVGAIASWMYSIPEKIGIIYSRWAPWVSWSRFTKLALTPDPTRTHTTSIAPLHQTAYMKDLVDKRNERNKRILNP